MKDNIVPQSAWIERRTADYQQRVEELRRTIRQRHAGEFESANSLARWRIWLRMRRELRAAIRKLPPSNQAV